MIYCWAAFNSELHPNNMFSLETLRNVDLNWLIHVASGVARGGAGGAMAPPLIWSVG